jgi:ATP-dependent DNA ligase
MAATLTQERFSGSDWIFERKFEGIRLITYKQGGDIQLFSRKTTCHRTFLRSRMQISKLPNKELILDGENDLGPRTSDLSCI